MASIMIHGVDLLLALLLQRHFYLIRDGGYYHLF